MKYKIDGELYDPIRVGEKGDVFEAFDREQVCLDCDAEMGELHGIGCEMETCPACGNALFSCGCYKDFGIFKKIAKWRDRARRHREKGDTT